MKITLRAANSIWWWILLLFFMGMVVAGFYSVISSLNFAVKYSSTDGVIIDSVLMQKQVGTKRISPVMSVPKLEWRWKTDYRYTLNGKQYSGIAYCAQKPTTNATVYYLPKSPEVSQLQHPHVVGSSGLVLGLLFTSFWLWAGFKIEKRPPEAIALQQQ
jgi:hypothetical protein